MGSDSDRQAGAKWLQSILFEEACSQHKITIPERRRKKLASIAKRCTLRIAEDDPSWRLADAPPPPLAPSTFAQRFSMSLRGHCAIIMVAIRRANRRFANGHVVPRRTSAMQQALPRFNTKGGLETAPRIPVSPHQRFTINATAPLLRSLNQPARTPIMQSNPLVNHYFDRMSLRPAGAA